MGREVGRQCVLPLGEDLMGPMYTLRDLPEPREGQEATPWSQLQTSDDLSFPTSKWAHPSSPDSQDQLIQGACLGFVSHLASETRAPKSTHSQKLEAEERGPSI